MAEIKKTCDDCYFKPHCYSHITFVDMDYCKNFKHKDDVVEVIRCKNCRWYNRRWGCRKLEINVSADNYCFMAEPAVVEVTVSLSDKKVLENLAKGSDTDNFIRTVMERQLMRMEDQIIRCKDCGYYNGGGFCRKHEIKTNRLNYCYSAKLAVSNNKVVPDEE